MSANEANDANDALSHASARSIGLRAAVCGDAASSAGSRRLLRLVHALLFAGVLATSGTAAKTSATSAAAAASTVAAVASTAATDAATSTPGLQYDRAPR